uniref:DUF834 domain-containing protein n=1 Tax=Oryza brachyantha TaxID=4533 RepID=J3NAR4_ORYBR
MERRNGEVKEYHGVGEIQDVELLALEGEEVEAEMCDPDAPPEREVPQVRAADGDAAEPHVREALASREREPMKAARLGHLRRRGVAEVEAIGQVEVREIRACGDERGEAGGAEAPGAGEVNGGEGGRGGERGEGGVGDAWAEGEIEAGDMRVASERGGEETPLI